MKRLVLSCALAAAIAFPAMAALKQGDSAPDFTAPASLAGKEFKFSLKDALKKGPVVVYFYPSAYTQGCNVQARTFATNKDKFDAAGATIIGVSLDSIARLNEFSADPEYCAGKVAVASDADGSIAKSYQLSIRDVPATFKDTKGKEIGHGLAERVTFIVGRDGKVAATVGGQGVNPTANVEQALAEVEKLKKG